MLSAVMFLTVILGFLYPRFVRRGRAFGVAVVLVVLELVAEALGVGSSYYWYQAVQRVWDYGPPFETQFALSLVLAIAPLLKVAAGIALLRAYWPGGRLMDIARPQPQQAAAEE